MLDQKTADGQTFVLVDADIHFVAKSDREVLEKVHHLDSRHIVIINQAVRLIDRETAHIQTLAKLMLTEVEKYALACL